MKASEKAIKKQLREFFEKRLESVNRSRRGEEDDYPEEAEGPATQYETVELPSLVSVLGEGPLDWLKDKMPGAKAKKAKAAYDAQKAQWAKDDEEYEKRKAAHAKKIKDRGPMVGIDFNGVPVYANDPRAHPSNKVPGGWDATPKKPRRTPDRPLSRAEKQAAGIWVEPDDDMQGNPWD